MNMLKKFVFAIIPGLRESLRTAAPFLVDLPAFVQYLKNIPNNSVIIASDKYALLPIFLSGRIPRVYYSLEATPFSEESYAYTRVLNLIEWFYLKVFRPLLISQSKARAAQLGYGRRKTVLLPVTCAKPAIPKSSKLRELLGIEPYQKVLMLAGGLTDDIFSNEIIESSKAWPKDYVLVLHSNNNQYSDTCRDTALKSGGRIKLTNLDLTASEAEDIIYPSADVGIVLYKDSGFNYRHTVFSSGKLAAFLRAGVPVLVSDFPEYDTLLNQYRVGLKCRVNEIPQKANKILENYKEFSSDATNAYSNIYNYKCYTGLVSSCIRTRLSTKESRNA